MKLSIKTCQKLIGTAITACVLTGCGESEPNPKREAVKARNLAKVKALRDASMAQAEYPAPDAELDPVLEEMAKQIEKDFETAQATVNEAKAHGGSGNCSMTQSVNSSTGNGEGVSTLTKNYHVTNPDGSGWEAVVEKRNGVVTKTERKEYSIPSSSEEVNASK